MFFMILRLTIKEYCNIEHFYLGDHDHELSTHFHSNTFKLQF